MIVSLEWLRQYVDIPVDVRTLVADLTMLGLNVEHCTTNGIDEPKVVVGHVLERSAHPDADRLSVCRVDVGEGEPRTIVCGAPNVAAGQKVPVALPGARLPGGVRIRRSRIRGVASDGMICSEVELGLGSDAAGILVLADDAPVGRPLSEVIEGDAVLEIEVTPNRPDQLGHVGVAREIAALYETPLRVPSPEVAEPAGDPGFTVDIDDPEDCYRFTGRIVRGVRVGPSPEWLREMLERVGLNSINNIVDVTNYVMMEFGQPLHAYDLDRLPGRRMGVRRARDGETLTALDERTYEAGPENLLITCDDVPVGFAGVIGGMDTRVTESTTNLLIESAAFCPRVIRASRKKLNLSTDASYRFERGTDREVCRRAGDRACELILRVAGGEAGGGVDAYPAPWPERRVRVRAAGVRRLLGVRLDVDRIESLLARLGFERVERDDEGVTVVVPSWRDDVHEEADLVEEVARLHGYDRIGEGWSFRTTSWAPPDPFDAFAERAAEHLAARGHTEMLLTSFTDGAEVERFGWGPDEARSRPVAVRNPLTRNQSHLRTSLVPAAVDVVRHNLAHGARTLKLFGCGAVYLAPDGIEAGLPREPRHVVIVHTRPDAPQWWREPGRAADLFDVRAEVEALARALRVDLSSARYRFDEAAGTFRYETREGVVAEGGILPAAVSRAADIDQGVWYAEIDLDAWFRAREPVPTFQPYAEYPEARRDLSLVVPESVAWADVEKALAKHGGRLLESHRVFDVYRGERLESGRYAVGVRLTFRSASGTLTDEDVDRVVGKITSRLESDLGVTLRR